MPGRVSFSKNDVYEIDFSDYENETDSGRSVDKSADSKSNAEQNELSSQSPVNNETNKMNDKKSNQYCCDLKCNTMACSSEDDIVNKVPYDPKKFQDIDESNEIIKEYQKSIENINRQYQIDNDKRSANLFSDIKLPFENISDDLKTYQSKKTEKLPENSIEMDDKHVHESADVEADQILNETTWFNLPTQTSNRNEEQHRPNTNDSIASASKDSYNSEVISNYMKEKSKKINVKSKKQQNINNNNNCSTQPPTSSRKLKTTMNRNINGQNNKTAVKSKVNHREESNIGEFQIDKVESWMSLHEKNFGKASSNNKLDRYVDNDDSSNSVDWSLKTPRKSIDEDDHFFIVDEDNVSIEESPYKEIVSIIKEIDEQKQLDLSKPT